MLTSLKQGYVQFFILKNHPSAWHLACLAKIFIRFFLFSKLVCKTSFFHFYFIFFPESSD